MQVAGAARRGSERAVLGVERLDHVVVSTTIERGDLVGLSVSYGEHHHRDGAEGA